MIVVKLGGSLLHGGELRACLAAAQRLTQRQAVVIVPGGGGFADRVRDAQQCWQLSDRACHDMALLAMHQTGLLLCDLLPACEPVEQLALLRVGVRPLAVWLPLPSELLDSGIPATWDVTSDSLAAWLAGRLQAEQLILVKSAAVGHTDVALLQQQGIVDAAFHHYLDSSCRLTVCNQRDFINDLGSREAETR